MKQPNDFRLIDVFVSLKYTAESPLFEPSDPENYILSVTAEILGSDFRGNAYSDDDSIACKSEISLGTLKFFLIRLASAYDEDFSFFEIFDVHQETTDAAGALFTPDFEDFNKTTKNLFPDAWHGADLLLLDRLEIQPFARGQKLGLAVILRAIQDWSSGCLLVVMKPFPLQFEAGPRNSAYRSSLDLADFPQDKAQATRKLRSYYEQLDFQRIGRSEFYAKCLMKSRKPVEELNIPHNFVVPQNAFDVGIPLSDADNAQ